MADIVQCESYYDCELVDLFSEAAFFWCRFRPMDNLSGGEKTVAALALLFGIHRFVHSNTYDAPHQN